MKIVTAFILIFGSVLLLGCDNSNDEVPPPIPTSLAITPDSVPELPVGGTQTFTATGTDTSGSTYDATLYSTWVSSDTNVATIDALGVATTIAVGTTTISASSSGIDASNTVGLTVSTNPVPPPTEAVDYTEDNVCRSEFCYTDSALAQQCQTFIDSCIAANPDENTDECVAGGLAICQSPDVPPTGVCTYGLCADPTIGGQCLTWLNDCLTYSSSDDECYGAMFFYCRVQD